MEKRILINEAQKEYIIQEEYRKALNEAFINAKNLEEFKEIIRRSFIRGASVAAILAAIASATIPNNEKKELQDYLQTEVVASKSEGFDEKVEAVKQYMEYALKNQGYSMDSTKLKPETLVKAAEESGFDLPFLMASAHFESCFGANKRAKRTNSVFSVGGYDDGRDMVTYSDPNQSVIPFINLIKRDYLVDGKSLEDLMVKNNFVNFDGKRYSSNPNYEVQLGKVRNRIVNMFPILDV